MERQRFKPYTRPSATGAADKDYELTVLSDGCADPNEEVHRVLMTSLFPSRGEVLAVDEWEQRVEAAMGEGKESVARTGEKGR